MNAFEYIMDRDEYFEECYEDICIVNKEKLRYIPSSKELLFSIFEDAQYAYMINKEDMDKLKSIELKIDNAAAEWVTVPRKPYYRIRGRRVTEEQAAEIICATETFRCQREAELLLGSMESIAAYDGTVGMNDHVAIKWIEINELLLDILQLKLRFPYLDYVMALSYWDEKAPELDWFESEYDKESDRVCEYENFEKNIQIGVWVHDNIIEIMNQENTKNKYEEYRKLYEADDKKIYLRSSEIYLEKIYIEKCMQHIPELTLTDREGFR